MPTHQWRASGQKKNYNLNYDRFSNLDDDDSEDDDKVSASSGGSGAMDAAPPDFSKMAGEENMPQELLDAFSMMRFAHMTGNEQARQKATELAMRAVEDGGPDVRARFEEAAKMMMGKQGITGDVPTSQAELEKAAASWGGAAASPADRGAELESVQDRMKRQLEATQEQMQELQRQQSQLESLQSPDDFFRFLHDRGFSQEDVQRALNDQEFGQQLMEKTFEKDQANAQLVSDDLMTQVEALSDDLKDVLGRNTSGDDGGSAAAGASSPSGSEKKLATEVVASVAAEAAKATRQGAPKQHDDRSTSAEKREKMALVAPDDGSPSAAVEEAATPEHQVQVVKDEASGAPTEIVVTISLPGVAGMADVDLEVSERQLRLSTKTAPLYLLRLPPFETCVDPNQARAKFSKKKGELVVRLSPSASV